MRAKFDFIVFAPKREKREKVKLSKQSWKQATKILSYFKPYWLKFSIGNLILIVSSALSMLFPALAGKLLDAVGNNQVDLYGYTFNGIDEIALTLFIVFAIQAVFSFFRIYIFNDVTERAIMKLRQDSYKHIVSLPMTFFSKTRVGELNSRLSSDIAQIQETFTIVIAELVRQAITLFIGIPVLVLYSPKLALTMLLILPILIVIVIFMSKWVKKYSKLTQKTISETGVIAEETFTAIQSVKAFANEALEITRFRRKTQEVKSAAMRGVFARAGMASVIVFGVFGTITTVIWQAAKQIESGELSNGDLASLLMYIIFVGASLAGTADLFARFQKGVGSTEDLFNLLDEKTEVINTSIKKKQQLFSGNIKFENVDFHYESRKEVQVLRNVNLEVFRGQSVALVGPSGSGKSTFTSLLLRFYDPTNGSISIDNKNVKEINLSDLRDQMAIVPQEVILFGGSIKENIAYGKPDASLEEIKAAAEKANALDFISQFPDGFETIVGERGIQLSGGQRQRIAIARAVLKDPSILILDEATSSLDSESERLVQEALDKLMVGRTSIVIAHRLSTIRKADKILVLKKGQIIESGTHDELVEIENGIYKNMSDLQLEVK